MKLDEFLKKHPNSVFHVNSFTFPLISGGLEYNAGKVFGDFDAKAVFEEWKKKDIFSWVTGEDKEMEITIL